MSSQVVYLLDIQPSFQSGCLARHAGSQHRSHHRFAFAAKVMLSW
jgi:hypothetical protein